ncbi:MAG: hypothetical protein CVU68_02135 [Deltaproteobacteria bacterium HGW-Deltaproteobacteria-3]|nr:MAG: hypothetical protein CVU68_02135 [Deltaproteobacteria bacterium HGW-Deltaproteobacteria-3]
MAKPSWKMMVPLQDTFRLPGRKSLTIDQAARAGWPAVSCRAFFPDLAFVHQPVGPGHDLPKDFHLSKPDHAKADGNGKRQLPATKWASRLKESRMAAFAPVLFEYGPDVTLFGLLLAKRKQAEERGLDTEKKNK